MTRYSTIFLILALLVVGRARNLKKKAREPEVKRDDFFDESNAEHWKLDAQWTLRDKLTKPFNTNHAKNMILFLGDGMSITTIAAARVYMAAAEGRYGMGEELKHSFEEFPFTGLARTYCVDRQVADSACSATAYLCGAKANYGTVSVSVAVRRGVCADQERETNRLRSIVAWAQDAGMKTGVVTTTRVTHASPAGTYARAAERGWESDTDVRQQRGGNCSDIASQLVRGDVGGDINVILGGGRRQLLPKTFKDSEGNYGSRSDGVDLISEWITSKKKQGSKPAYVYNRNGLINLDVNDYDYLLGLFDPDHMPYHLDADSEEDPSLAEMTTRAIEFLSHNNPNGYFLFVEGGRIDQAHHDTKARKALDETAEFSKAVAAAVKLVNQENTLIVVTSDHSHTMTYNGYNSRGSDVLGASQMKAADGLPYMILTYANGPGYRRNDENNRRHNVLLDKINHVNYTYPAQVPLESETHGGEDVAVFAQGPWSHLFTGAWEQTHVPHAMAYAGCIGPGLTSCD